MPDEFQAIHRTSDPIEAEILADLLSQSGIDARVIGTRHGALIGVAQHILALRVEVPAAQAKDACEIVDAYLAEHKAAPGEETEPELSVGDDGEPEGPRPLRRVLAAGITPIFPGGGHFYARRPAAGFVAMLGYLGALSTLVGAPERDREMAAILMFAGVFLFDLVGAQLAVRSFNRGFRASVRRQLAVALSILAAVGVGSHLLAPHVPDLPSRRLPLEALEPAPAPLSDDLFPLPLQPAQ